MKISMKQISPTFFHLRVGGKSYDISGEENEKIRISKLSLDNDNKIEITICDSDTIEIS